MGRLSPRPARRRMALAIAITLALTLIAAPVAAGPQQDVNGAQQALNAARAAASAGDRAFAAARASLAAANARLRALALRIASLDSTIATDAEVLRQLRRQLAGDRAHLSAYLRQSYENGGSEAMIAYIVSSGDIATAMQRDVQVNQIATASRQLVARIDSEQAAATRTLAQDHVARAQLGVAEEQARTAAAVVAVEEEQEQAADIAAHHQVSQAQVKLTSAKAALAAAQAADVVYTPIPGAAFTVDTNLTLPSGETAARLDQFLSGTALAGLGTTFMHAQQTYHVSARYFVAHAILESAWGSSAIAQDKHNLFGFGANDRNPYGDAMTFPSFDACIQFVAQFVAVNYLAPGGSFFHGPTLRGMNVDYASDPNWASKIATIARTIP